MKREVRRVQNAVVAKGLERKGQMREEYYQQKLMNVKGSKDGALKDS